MVPTENNLPCPAPDDGNGSSFWNAVFGKTEDHGQCPK
jgi:hypothetical protein